MTNIGLNGTAAVPIQQVTASGFSLQNNGPGNVYLDNNASVSPSSGYIVQPGVSLPLNANTVLYACTDVNQTANIQLLQGATATQATIVEANVPNAVNVSGSVAITNATVPVTGNVAITNASIPVSGNVGITGGAVNVTGSSVSVAGGQVGTLSQSNTAMLMQATLTWANATGSYYLSSTDIARFSGIDVSAYTSIYISINTPGVINGALQNYLDMSVTQHEQSTLAASLAPYALDPQWLCVSGLQSISAPVNRKYLTVSPHLTIGSLIAAGTLTVSIFGSGQTVTDPEYISNGINLLGDIAVGGTFSLLQSNAATTSSFVGTKNGSATIACGFAGGTPGTATWQLAESGVYQYFLTQMCPGSAGTTVQDVMLPMRPLHYNFTTTSGSSTYIDVNQ